MKLKLGKYYTTVGYSIPWYVTRMDYKANSLQVKFLDGGGDYESYDLAAVLKSCMEDRYLEIFPTFVGFRYDSR